MKHSIEEIRREYDRLDKLLGVDTSKIVLSVSTRCVNRYGACKYGKDRMPREICITDFIMDCEDEFWNTVRHEYAHAIVRIRYPKERHGHDNVWRSACLEVGCRPERCSADPEAANFSHARRLRRAENRVPSDWRYAVSCDTCGREWKYKSKGKIVKIAKGERSGTLRCPHCGGKNFSFDFI